MALFAHGFAFLDAEPVHALEALLRGLESARDSCNRYAETLLAGVLSGVEAEHGDPLAALDHITLAIRNFHDGATSPMSTAEMVTYARDQIDQARAELDAVSK